MLHSTAQSYLAVAVCIAWVAADSHIAYWTGPRAVAIQDFVFVDGGEMYTGDYVDNQTLVDSDDQWGYPSLVNNPSGMLYNISLEQSFTTNGSTNIDDLLNHMPYETDHDLHWVYGAIFANEHEFYTFGGLPEPNTNVSASLHGSVHPPSGSSVREQNQNNTLGSAAFVANGAWTNAAPVNQGYWFSGLRAANNGTISYDADSSENDLANTPAARLIQVNMSTTGAPVWTLLPWASNIAPRAEAGLVWLPYGTQGLLVAFGGIQVPADFLAILSNSTFSNNFMNEIVIYDIETSNWAIQETLGPYPG